MQVSYFSEERGVAAWLHEWPGPIARSVLWPTSVTADPGSGFTMDLDLGPIESGITVFAS